MDKITVSSNSSKGLSSYFRDTLAIILNIKRIDLLIIPVFIFIISYTAFAYSARFFPTNDSLPNNYTAMNLLYNKRVDMTNFKILLDKSGLTQISVKNKENKLYAKTPVILGILSVPAFWLAGKIYGIKHLTDQQIFTSPYNQHVGKLYASFLSAVSGVLMFFILFKITKKRWISFTGALVYCLGTNVFNTASQANWQHGISLFLIALALLVFITDPKNFTNISIAGLIGGLLVQIRISNVFYLIFFGLFIFTDSKIFKKSLGKIFLLAAASVFAYGIIFLFNLWLKVPYGYMGEVILSFRDLTAASFLKNFISILFSFNFGLFFFNPILLLSFPVLFLKTKIPHDEKKILFPSFITIALFIVFASTWWMWTGGRSLNARMLSESMPLFIILLSMSCLHFSKSILFKTIFSLMFIISIFVNVLTTYCFEEGWYTSNKLPEGHKNQYIVAWYRKPIMLASLMKLNYIHIDKIYKKGDRIIKKATIYRPSFHYRGIVKIFEIEENILDIEQINR